MSTPRKQAEGIVEIYLIELNTPSIETRRAKQNLIDNIAKALGAAQPKPAAEVVEELEGYVRTSDGVARKLIGTLAVTKDGAVVCDGEEVWHPEQDMSFHLKVMSLYGDMRPEPDDEFPLPDDCTHMGHYSYYERDTGYSQYESRDVRECYSTKEAALAAQSAREKP